MVFQSIFSYGQFMSDGIVATIDSTNLKTKFIVGEAIYFFLRLENTTDIVQKDVSFNFVSTPCVSLMKKSPQGDYVDIDEESHVPIENTQQSEKKQKLPKKVVEVYELDSTEWVKPRERDYFYSREICFRKYDHSSLIFYPELALAKRDTNNWQQRVHIKPPPILLPGEYRITTKIYLSDKYGYIYLDFYFEVLPFPNKKVEGDYVNFLKALGHEISKEYDIMAAVSPGDSDAESLYSYMKNPDNHYLSEALHEFVFFNGKNFSKHYDYYDKLGVDEYVYWLINNKIGLLSDDFLYRYIYLSDYILMSAKGDLWTHSDEFLKSISDKHPAISEIYIKRAKVYGVNGLINYAAQKK